MGFYRVLFISISITIIIISIIIVIIMFFRAVGFWRSGAAAVEWILGFFPGLDFKISGCCRVWSVRVLGFRILVFGDLGF